jgi:hypothetical protein
MRSNWPFSRECPSKTVSVRKCKACGSITHRNAKSFECPEHKCMKCKGALDAKAHNKNNCPDMLDTICTLCEEVGHDKERCPMRPCPACGNRTHKSPTHFECPEHICATCGEKGHNRTNCPASQQVNKCDRPFCSRMSIQNCQHMHAARAATQRISNTATLATHNHNSVFPLCTNANVILGHNRGKWSDKFSAVKIIVDHIYLMPLPLTPSDTLSVNMCGGGHGCQC